MARPKKIETADSIAIGKIETTQKAETVGFDGTLKEILVELKKINEYLADREPDATDETDIALSRRYVVGL